MSAPWFFRVVVSSVVASDFTTVTAAMGASIVEPYLAKE